MCSSRRLRTSRCFAGLHFDEAGFQIADAVIDEAAVLFELRFAGAARADAAGGAAKVAPHLPQTRQGVFQLGQLHLQTGFDGARPRGENVENQLAAVEHFELGGLFQIADLAGDRSLSKMITSASVARTCSCSSWSLPLPM